MTTLILQERFAAAHFYLQKSWGPDQNLAVFGKCHDPHKHGHGHNYRVEVAFLEPRTPRNGLQQGLHEIAQALDHHHLNYDIPEFQGLVPTTENIALYLLKKLQERFANERISSIKLLETDDLWVEIEA